MSTFKPYSNKSKARRALVAKLPNAAEADYIYMADVDGTMKWGFDLDDEGLPVAPIDEAEPEAPTWAGLKDRSNPWKQLNGTHTVPDSARNVQKGPPITKEGKIEKDRPEQNGVKQPSIGTICREIWDWLSDQNNKGDLPSLMNARSHLNEKGGLDRTTVTVQYYRWRKFNGIKGRASAAA